MISLIAGVADNGCIGIQGKLPWHIPEDMKHFKEMTMGKTVVMGRKTWESIPEKFRPLPNRKNVVVTRQSGYAVPADVETFASLNEAIAAHKNDPEIVVIGGAEIYAQAISKADQLYITHVHQSPVGDTFFPTINPTVWSESAREDYDGFSFVTYVHRN